MVSCTTYSRLCQIKEWLLTFKPGEDRTFDLWKGVPPIRVHAAGGKYPPESAQFMIVGVTGWDGVWRNHEAMACGILFLLGDA